MRLLGNIRKGIAVVALLSVAGSFAAAQTVQKYRPPVADLEISMNEPMPPGFGVQQTDVDGPVFTDARGMTIYDWPFRNQELGDPGDHKDNASKCTDVKTTVTSGSAEIYPAGYILPDLDIRPSCTQAWPPVLASADAKPVGKWTISERPDGKKQWAYEGMPLYTSNLDTKPGQVNGGMRRPILDGQPPPFRFPVGPPALTPPAFSVKSIATGRVLMNAGGLVVYSFEGDRPNVSNCKGECLKEWVPVLAAATAQAQGEWGVIERAPGVKQWTFRSMPVYTYILDKKRGIVGARGTSLMANDMPGWHPVYTQKWPDPPKELTVQDSHIGQVMADKNGMTLYTYLCADDAWDQLSCDHPTQTQTYRLAICGKGSADTCNKIFPYAVAPKDATTNNLLWGVAWINPKTGRLAKADDPGAIHVWTFRERPIYTHGSDKKPGDARGDSWGEENGLRNGYHAMWIRDDFFGLAS